MWFFQKQNPAHVSATNSLIESFISPLLLVPGSLTENQKRALWDDPFLLGFIFSFTSSVLMNEFGVAPSKNKDKHIMDRLDFFGARYGQSPRHCIEKFASEQNSDFLLALQAGSAAYANLMTGPSKDNALKINRMFVESVKSRLRQRVA